MRTPEDFWKKVDKKNGPSQPRIGRCWIWLGSTYERGGHAQAYYCGQGQPAQRVAWTITHGGIPKGICVLHKCDNPICVRPSHLFLGTPKDNSQDMVRKGRWNGRRGPLSEEAKAKISAANKGKQPRLGAILSDETKAKIGAANRARRAEKKKLIATSIPLHGSPRNSSAGTPAGRRAPAGSF